VDRDVSAGPDAGRPEPAGQLVHVVGELGHGEAPAGLREHVQIVIEGEQRGAVPGRGRFRHGAEMKAVLPYRPVDHEAFHPDRLLYGVRQTFGLSPTAREDTFDERRGDVSPGGSQSVRECGEVDLEGWPGARTGRLVDDPIEWPLGGGPVEDRADAAVVPDRRRPPRSASWT
jgi:hypothetical protein